MKIVKGLYLIFYYLIASNLPNYSFPMGKLFNWIRVKSLGKIIPLGKNCRIMRKVYIGDGDRISIGDNCKINEGCRLCNVQIGNNIMIARNHVFIGAQHNHKRTDVPMIEQGFSWGNPTIIEDDVWIGLNVVIMPGVEIARGCIIGSGSIVTKNTEAYGIYGSGTAKLIKKRKQ